MAQIHFSTTQIFDTEWVLLRHAVQCSEKGSPRQAQGKGRERCFDKLSMTTFGTTAPQLPLISGMQAPAIGSPC